MEIKRYLLFLFMLFFASYLPGQDGKEGMMPNDFRLFKGTPAWPLAKAIESDDLLLLEKEAQTNSPDLNFQESKYGTSLLLLSVRNMQTKIAQKLLELGADVNIHDHSQGSSAIIIASRHGGGMDMLQMLLKYGANPNDEQRGKRIRSSLRETPLMNAAQHSLSFVILLVEAGADINHLDEFGNSALKKAILGFKKFDIALYLLERGADYKRPFYEKNGKMVRIQEILRETLVPIDSDDYVFKMQIVDFLMRNGIDYRKIPIPDNCIMDAKRMYPDTWREYLEKY